MSGYDFDGTIYKKDSSVEFYLFLLKRKPYLIYKVVILMFNYVLYKLHLKKKIKVKEGMFSILKHFNNIDDLVQLFWQDKELEKWYLKQQKSNDLVISASPYFLLKPICDKYKIKNLIATDVNKKTGKFKGPNVYGQEKLRQFEKKYPNVKLNAFYSDSLSDEVMSEVSNKFFQIKNSKVII